MKIPFLHLLQAALLVCSLCLISPAMAQEPATAQETKAQPEQAAAPAGIEQLAWMVGDWGEQGEDSRISTSCGWTRNQSFLTRSFSVTNNNEVLLEGTQIIGWNAAENQIQSWTFDSEGGHGQGYWTRDGNRWTVKTHFVLSTGERASSLNVFTIVDNDTIHWQSVNRERGGELLPNIEEIIIVRKPAVEQAEPEQAEPGQAK